MAEVALIHFDRARQELAEAVAVDEVKTIRDQAEALRAYYRQRDGSLEMANQCAEIKVRAERRLGELLADTVRQGGHNSKSNDATLLPSDISRDQSSDWQAIARIPEPEFEAHIAETKAAGEPLTTAGVLRLGVHYSSASPEWLTPPHIVKLVETVLGVIDLDPCADLGCSVPASTHFTEPDNGLTKLWQGRVYMNPPYGDVIEAWVRKLRGEFEAGNVSEAIALVPARVDTGWFRLFRDYLVCFVAGRLRFSSHENSAPFPSALVYLGPNSALFASEAAQVGDVYARFC